MTDRISFKVNGVQHSVGSEVSSDIMLVDYLRNTLELRGTKYMCREGGCGACTVNASTTPGTACKAINSCMVSVTSCQDWEITTIEGLGNKHDGYHPLQTAVAEHHATQCGYCTPGWVMSMNGLLESTNRNVTMLEVEQAFGSNVCRCTGYRPLAECFKKFAKDAPKEHRIVDIENLALCKKKGKPCSKNNNCAEEEDWCIVNDEDLLDQPIKTIRLKDGKLWYRPNYLHEVLGILQNQSSGSDYMLVAGNTAKGAFPIDEYPCLLIDISHLQELKTNVLDQNFVVGAGFTLTEFLSILKANSTLEYFSYFEKLHEHISLVAHVPVRNVGTIAGNLMIKHKHNVFQSDIFLLLETVGAQLNIINCYGGLETHTMQSFLGVNMNQKIILSVLLPPLSNEYKLITFKIMPRAQSVHAIVNAGFLFKIDTPTQIVKQARIVYGALSPKFIRASATESFLVEKQLFTNQTLQAALGVLDGELIVEENPPEASVAYRKQLAKALFYKALLTISPPTVRTSRFNSGTLKLHESRGVSDGKQIFTTDPTKWPLTQPIQKVEGLYQSAGEAIYTDDMPKFPNEVFGAFVLSTVATGTIVNIDATNAMRLKGVIAVYTAKDIPGLNSFTPADSLLYTSNEEVLAEGTVKYYHQPLGIIVAEDQHIANRAAKLVQVKYSNVKKPVLDVKTAKGDSTRNTLFFSSDATNRGTDIHKVITGNTTFYGQYHFTMETLVAIAKPTEEGLEVYSSTQWLDGSHVMISRALGIDQNRIDMHLRRIGGAYGMKISRSIQSAVACSLVCQKLNRPCRFIQPLTTNMQAVGKRLPFSNDYEVAVNKSGVIQYINETMYEDNGYKTNETLSALGTDVYYNCYDATKFNYKVFDTITDTAKNTWCRSPGTLEAIAACEYIMERIAYELSLDPIAVRLANLDTAKHNDISEMIQKFKIDTEYDTRRAAVDSFNTENRWKKRGLRFSFARWAPVGAQRFDVNLSVFHGDGTIVLTHAGVEMGQGINTKAIQTAAYLLKVPVNKIQVKANNTTIAPNSFISGGSLTTQSVIIGLRRCCEQLLTRLEPIRATLTNPTWEELIKAAYNADVDLQVHGFSGATDTQTYNVYGIALSEVEIDCLTGEYEILRVDLLQDVGLSISPEIDVGQVEGGFIMAMGYWTCEKLVYESETGKLLTNRTWDYHVPEMRDIPQKFNVYFRKSSFSNELILGSKATGEPSSCAAVCVTFALREAIAAARQETGLPTTQWFQIVRKSPRIPHGGMSDSTKSARRPGYRLPENQVYPRKESPGSPTYCPLKSNAHITHTRNAMFDGPFTTEAVFMAANTKTEEFKY